MNMEPVRHINEWLILNEQQSPDHIYLKQPREGEWHHFTWKKVMHQARKVANFLKQIGLKKGDRVAIFSKNCAQWFITDFGISLAGMVSVPLFANQHPLSLKYVLEHAEVKLVFIGKLDDHLKVRNYIPNSLVTVNFDYHLDLQTTYAWSFVLSQEPLKTIEKLSSDDLFTIIYTSGTSYLPKGAVFTHGIIASYLSLFPEDIKRITRDDEYHFISYLPLAHVYERSAIELGSITIRSDISFIESLDKFNHNLKEIQPTFFTAVPRIWGIFQQKIIQKIPPEKLKKILRIPLVSTFIKYKIKKQLGLGRCTNFFSGASHLPLDIFHFFEQLNIPIQEGYGQTENLAYATVSLLSQIKPGYVGTPRLQVTLQLTEEKELMVKSPCLMKEYYKDSEATHLALREGWLYTGDVVEMDAHQNIKIEGRLSENFKNQKGEFITPTPIEMEFLNNSLIDQLCLVGRELPCNILLISLNEKGKQLSRSKINQILKKQLGKINNTLASFEKIRHIIVVDKNWNPENGLLTPTLKVRRREVESFYQEQIHLALAQHESINWESSLRP